MEGRGQERGRFQHSWPYVSVRGGGGVIKLAESGAGDAFRSKRGTDCPARPCHRADEGVWRIQSGFRVSK